MELKKKAIFWILTAFYTSVIMLALISTQPKISGYVVFEGIKATRIFPAVANLNEPAEIILNLEVIDSDSINGLVIEETIPAGWTLESAGYDKFDGSTISWLFWPGGSQLGSRQLKYKIKPTTTSGVFSGKLITTAGEDSIGGDSQLNLLPVPPGETKTGFLDPNEDIEINTEKCPMQTAFECVSHPQRQPDEVTDTNPISGNIDGRYDVFGMTSLNMLGGVATNIAIWSFSGVIESLGNDWLVSISTDSGNSWSNETPLHSQQFAWSFANFGGSWTQQEIDNLRVRLRVVSPSGTFIRMRGFYAEVVYIESQEPPAQPPTEPPTEPPSEPPSSVNTVILGSPDFVLKRAGDWEGDPLPVLGTGSEPWNGTIMSFDVSSIPQAATITGIKWQGITALMCDSPQEGCRSDEVARACNEGGTIKFFSMPKQAQDYATAIELFSDLSSNYDSGTVFAESSSYCKVVSCPGWGNVSSFCGVGYGLNEEDSVDLSGAIAALQNSLSFGTFTLGMMIDQQGHYWFRDQSILGPPDMLSDIRLIVTYN